MGKGDEQGMTTESREAKELQCPQCGTILSTPPAALPGIATEGWVRVPRDVATRTAELLRYCRSGIEHVKLSDIEAFPYAPELEEFAEKLEAALTAAPRCARKEGDSADARDARNALHDALKLHADAIRRMESRAINSETDRDTALALLRDAENVLKWAKATALVKEKPHTHVRFREAKAAANLIVSISALLKRPE